MGSDATARPENTRSGSVLQAALALAGVGLAGYGSYLHLSLAAQVRAGRCDACEPWHPLVVVAPIVVGVVLVCGPALWYRR